MEWISRVDLDARADFGWRRGSIADSMAP